MVTVSLGVLWWMETIVATDGKNWGDTIRLTIDLDSWWFTDLQRVIQIAEEMGLGFPAVIRKSPRKTGYHLIWYNVSKGKVRKMRILADDIRRLARDDLYCEKPKQVLFIHKEVGTIEDTTDRTEVGFEDCTDCITEICKVSYE